jgi:FtsP/CotA-like multicopper oxidase with cupredoxin domain
MSDRRTLLRGLAAAGASGAAIASGLAWRAAFAPPLDLGPLIARAEAARSQTGISRDLKLHARVLEIDTGGRVVSTWGYGDGVPGAPLRAVARDRMRVTLRNELPEATSVHWHGLAIRNDMDGVPGTTTPETPPGGEFAFDFAVTPPGTHWIHPHHGLQLDRGLYAPLIVDDPNEAGAYDAEWVLVLDDWTDGIGPSPEALFAALGGSEATHGQSHGTGMMGGASMNHMGGAAGGSGMGAMGGMGAMDSGDVDYSLFMVNGRAPSDPDTLTVRPKQIVRLRVINAAADTVFDVALGGHRLTVTHTDGFAVEPVETGWLRIGMGERYDAVVSISDGIWPFVAEAVGRGAGARALAVIRTTIGAAPRIADLPATLLGQDGRPLTADRLRAGAGTALPRRTPEAISDLVLSGSMSPYVWTINGVTYDRAEPFRVRQGELHRFRVHNMSMMSHPVHVHGHTFQLGGAGGVGPRKDTVLVPPMGMADLDLVADNPGRWMIHCHNAYHLEAGMMGRLDYV